VSELFERIREVDLPDSTAALLSAAAGAIVGAGLAALTVWWLPIAAGVAVTVAAILPVRTHAKHRRH
jgi:hypothetical protein